MTSTPCRYDEWVLASVDEAAVRTLADAAGLTPVTARILLARGIADADSVRAFLAPDLARDWVDPTSIPGMHEAAVAVADAVRTRRRIVVFGDFDVDGISSAALTMLGLRALGADVVAMVPHRFREGYGLTEASFERLLALEPRLVVTVDCGISSAEEVAALGERGVDFVVTDHHEPGENVPAGVPVANPKLGDGPASVLAGAGVALALVQAVGESLDAPGVWRELTDLAALGTVADMVPLVGPNRALVSEGLRQAREAPRAGVAALCAEAGVECGGLDADTIAFALAPRLNAAGRMADPALALELLVTEDHGRAAELAGALGEHNRVRQSVEQELFDAALASAEEQYQEGDRLLLVAGEEWHEGVRGIVASRLAGRFGVPTIVVCLEDGEARGSGRSVADVDLYAAVAEAGDLLTRFGGHAAAVGVTLPAERLETFRQRLVASLASVPADRFHRAVAIDAISPLDGLSVELAAELALLGPFGHSNPRPLLGTRGVFMESRKRVGRDHSHLKFTAYDGVASLSAIAFRCPEIETLAGVDSAVDLAFELDVDVWRGAQRVQMLVRDFSVHQGRPDAPAAELVEDLFEHAEEIIARGDYAGIEDAESFHTKLAGVTFEGRQERVARLAAGMPLRIAREPSNPYDANACALFDPYGDQVGYFNRRLAEALAPVLDQGVEYDVTVTDVTGGEGDRSLGVNVLVARRQAEGEAAEDEGPREERERLAALPDGELLGELVRAFIGERQLHDAQRLALEHLGEGRSCLCVMATGRGKSLIFHAHAARTAIVANSASVFVYPLRALVADQAFHLAETLGPLGVRVRTLTGETPPGRRDEAFTALAEGGVDVVLTTPEFIDHHAVRFAEAGRVEFVVVDEAHHVGLSRAGHRPAYARLDRALAALGSPVVAAVTATATNDVAEAVAQTLGVTATVLDPTVRDNLHVEDQRECKDKVALLASVASRGEKVITYVNSRDRSVSLARELRHRVPALRHRVAFYNGGLTRDARHAVERAFRDGHIDVVVATSAFGEGVNIPDVRHVVLFHLPFNAVEFNQMSGRAGRDGRPASIHLLYGPKDAKLNRTVLESLAPARDDLAALYLVLSELAREADGDLFEMTNAELAERVKARRPGARLNDSGVSAGIGVFRELGLVESEGHGAYRRLRLAPRPDVKLDLASSVRYAEGREELEEFEEFKDWALRAAADELLAAFNRPILPTQPSSGKTAAEDA